MSGWDALLGDEAQPVTTTQPVAPAAAEPVVQENIEQEIRDQKLMAYETQNNRSQMNE